MDDYKKEQVDSDLSELNIDIAFRPIECDAAVLVEQMDCGYMVAGVCGDDFLYIYEKDGVYELCLHTFGSDNAGRQSVPKGEQADELFTNLCKLAEVFIAVRYQAGMPIIAVMQNTEEVLISSNPVKYRPMAEKYLREHPEATPADINVPEV